MALIARSEVEEEVEGDNNDLPPDGAAWDVGLSDSLHSNRSAATSPSEHTGVYFSSGLVSPSSSSDKDSKSSARVDDNGKRGENQHQDSSITFCVQGVNEKDVNNLRVKLKNPRVNCDVCGKEVKRRSLWNHKLWCSSGERVSCEHCGKNIKKNHLKRHIKRVHNDNQATLVQ